MYDFKNREFRIVLLWALFHNKLLKIKKLKNKKT